MNNLKPIIVSPSLLSCDFANMQTEIERVTHAGADWLHVDVMDGHFVKNLTIGPPVVAAISKVSKVPLDVHLMIEKPEKYITQFMDAGSKILTIHVESTDQCESILTQIKDRNIIPGITLRPGTPVEKIVPYLEMVGLVLIMTVEPGFGGQSFMDDQVKKIDFISNEAAKKSLDLHIEVDGGINAETAKICRQAGANVFVAGNYIFKNDYAKSIRALKGV